MLKSKRSTIVLFVVALLVILSVGILMSPANTEANTANAVSYSGIRYSNYSGYTKVTEYEHDLDTANPKLIVVYRSNAGTKYVRNTYIGDQSMYHVEGRATKLTYRAATTTSSAVGGATEASVGATTNFFGNGVDMEVSLRIGYSWSTDIEKGTSVTFTLTDAPTGDYMIAQSIAADEFIIDVYDATWTTVTETYKEGKSTKTRQVQKHSGYSSTKNSQLSGYKIYFATKDAQPFYEVVKL